MPQKVSERLPAFGMVFFVKYTFDQKTWHQFWAEKAIQNGNLVTFLGCKVKMEFVNPYNGSRKTFSTPINDMPLDGNKVRTVGLVVRRPTWFDLTEEEAREVCMEQVGTFDVVGLHLTAA